jgi:hypothetical protein
LSVRTLVNRQTPFHLLDRSRITKLLEELRHARSIGRPRLPHP